MDDEYINESAETQEVAEPETDVAESAETQEVAEPETAEQPSDTEAEPAVEHRKTDSDARFAEMRRQNQQLEQDNKRMMEALQRYFEGETAEDLSINAMAYADQRDPEEYREEYTRRQEYETLKAENDDLKNQLFEAQVERLMREGLREVREIDPNVNSLEDLGESFAKFIAAGLSSKEAYWASQAQTKREKILAPDAIGRVSESKAERDYYTSDELDNLTDEEMDKNWDKVMRSLERLAPKG